MEQNSIRQVTAGELGLEPIDLEDDELVDGAILIVRTQLSGNQTRLVTRTSGGDFVVWRGMLEHTLDGMKGGTPILAWVEDDDEDKD